jgi:hypothetical protein
MEKVVNTLLAGGMSLQSIQGLLKNLLAQESSVPSPSEEICQKIKMLQGLSNMTEGTNNRFYRDSNTSNWRKNDSSSQGFNSKWRESSAKQSVPRTYTQSQPGKDVANGTNIPPPPTRYQSKFKNTSQPVEEKILNNIILSKLNKFSASTYADIRDFLYQILGSGESNLSEFIRDFMRLVFRKAACEDTFCPLYAKLLSEISTKYSVILDEMKNLSDNYLEIFDEVEQTDGESYDEFVQRNREKKYRLGYSQFLAELTRLEIIPLEILVATFTKVVILIQTHGKNLEKKALIEEYADCLLKMTKVFKGRYSQFSSSARAALLPTIEPLNETLKTQKEIYVGCTSKTRFALMDIHDILANSK